MGSWRLRNTDPYRAKMNVVRVGIMCKSAGWMDHDADFDFPFLVELSKQEGQKRSIVSKIVD